MHPGATPDNCDATTQTETSLVNLIIMCSGTMIDEHSADDEFQALSCVKAVQTEVTMASHCLLPFSQYEADFSVVAQLDNNLELPNDHACHDLDGQSERFMQEALAEEIDHPGAAPHDQAEDAAFWRLMLDDCLTRQLKAVEETLDAGITQPAQIWADTSQWLRDNQDATEEEFKQKLREYLRRVKKAAKNRAKRQKNLSTHSQ